MRLLVTRPEADAARTADTFRARGHAVLVAPLLRMEVTDADLGPDPAAVLFTSANAVRALTAHPQHDILRRLPVYAVGARTAAAAHAAGFAEVAAGDGDVQALAGLIAEARRDAGGTLLHLAGEERAGDLAGALAARGFAVHTVVLYRMVAADIFPPEAADALAAGSVDGVLHYSRRSAEIFLDCAGRGGLLNAAVKLAHYCLSAQVAAPLAAAGAATLHIASRPQEAALIELVG
jgi:uroporphyrinogen-III synthase